MGAAYILMTPLMTSSWLNIVVIFQFEHLRDFIKMTFDAAAVGQCKLAFNTDRELRGQRHFLMSSAMRFMATAHMGRQQV